MFEYPAVVAIIGSFSNDDGDGYENVKTTIGLLNETSTLHVRHAFLYISLLLLPGGALGYCLGGYVPPGTPNWHPVLKRNSPKIDTPF